MTISVSSNNIVPDRNFEHWVCFACRKMFKRPSLQENDGTNPKAPRIAHKCPECQSAMINMGLYFEPPRQRNWADWQRMKLLADYGYFFYTEGSKVYIEKFIVGKPPLSVRNLRQQLDQIEKTDQARSHQQRYRHLQEYKRDNARLRRMK